ncbi:MAG TPA: GNAT family N-acetyltransferase, partial [Roseovarius nubinhibens]|nr:GNAT family N-acetyltransferase [Roseovarius nubinhibens]
MLIIEPADPTALGPRTLLEASHRLMIDTFPADDIYALDIADLQGADIRFFAAR